MHKNFVPYTKYLMHGIIEPRSWVSHISWIGVLGICIILDADHSRSIVGFHQFKIIALGSCFVCPLF